LKERRLTNPPQQPTPALFRLADLLAPLLVGLALAAWYWRPLLEGAGFIGGDVYNYFMPLKTYYAEGLARGELRFWHPGIGNGVSVLGESQTGMFYPFHLLAYRMLPVATAYNAVFLLHYVLAYVFFYWLARGRGLSASASLFASLVYVYSWFPARACLEWSIITGAWTPLQLHFAFRFLETGKRRFGWGLAAALCIQLLAGHYQLAWVSIVAVLLVVLLNPLPGLPRKLGWSRRLAAAMFLGVGLLTAAPQLLPTWELKRFSKRSEADFANQVSYGRVPPKYLVGWIQPWAVYSDPDEWLKRFGGDTNRIEAHLYFGLTPLAIAAFALVVARGRVGPRWLWAAPIGLFLATGIPFLWLRYVPGFSFFRYPGRYSLIVAAFGALLVGFALDGLKLKSRILRWLLVLVFAAVTLPDLKWVGDSVGYAVYQRPPALEFVGQSQVFKRLHNNDRILAPDGNTLAISGAACVPPYIGLEPALYHSFWSVMPDVFKGETKATPDVLAILRKVGVTHILTELPLPEGWPVELLWSGADAFLHRRWGRGIGRPLYLYAFRGGPGRVFFESATDLRPQLKVENDRFAVHLPNAAPANRLHLTEWRLPGWTAAVDGKPVEMDPNDPFMVVAVPAGAKEVVFSYTPIAFVYGCAVSAFALITCMAVEFVLRRGSPLPLRARGRG
jgi:hypothetical protein